MLLRALPRAAGAIGVTTLVIMLYEKPASVATVRVLVGQDARAARRDQGWRCGSPEKSWKVWTWVARAEEAGPSGVRLWPWA